MQFPSKASFSMAIAAITLSGLCATIPAQAQAPIIFADGITVFTDKTQFDPAADLVCKDVDKVWFDSTVANIGPAKTIFAQTDDGNGVTFMSTSDLTGTNGHSDAQGPFTQIGLTPTKTDCNFSVLGLDITRGTDSLGKEITFTLSSGDKFTDTLDSTNTFFGIIAPSGFGGVKISSDGELKSIQEVRICGDACTDSAVPEPGALTTIALGGVSLLGALLLGNRRFGKSAA